MLNIFLFSFIFPGCCFAISWFKTGSSTEALDMHKVDSFDIGRDVTTGFTEQDAAALRVNLDALQAYTHKPDCFKNVAGQIQGRCSEADMDQDTRVSSAISMTLCEVGTATHYSIPLECRLFTTDAKSDFTKIPSRARGDCVDDDAVAHWRGAPNYGPVSRDICAKYVRPLIIPRIYGHTDLAKAQLCHAFRRWNDIDLARNLYYNATMEKIELIRFIRAREKTAMQNAEAILQRVTEMSDITQTMKSYQDSQRAHDAALIVHMQETFNELTTRLWESSQQAVSIREASDEAAAARAEAQLMTIMRTHSLALSRSLDSLIPATASRLDTILSQHEMQLSRWDSRLGETASKWLAVEHGFAQMENAILQIFADTGSVTRDLVNAVQDIQTIRVNQEETKAAASALTDALFELTNTTRLELDRINLTVHDIGQQLHVQLQHDVHPWKHIVMKTLELVYRADPGSLSHVEELFSFKVFLTVLGFGWTALRGACSVAAALATLAFLATRRAFLNRKDLWDCLSLLGTSTLVAAPGPELKQLYATVSVPKRPPPLPGTPAGRMLRLAGSNSGSTSFREQTSSGRHKRVSRIPDRLCLAA